MYKDERSLNYAYEDEVKITIKQVQKDGSKVIRKEVQASINKQVLGDLQLATGQIVANDPFVCFETDPFTVTVTPGSYPVSISVVHLPCNGYGEDKRVALAMIKFSDKKPVRWEMALTNEKQAEELDTIKEGNFFGYGVDSGTGGFMDKTVADKLAEQEKSGEYIYDKFEDEFNAAYAHTYSYILADATGSGDNDFVAFSSGFGDGCYPSYFAFDGDGEPCALVTDFCAIDF